MMDRIYAHHYFHIHAQMQIDIQEDGNFVHFLFPLQTDKNANEMADEAVRLQKWLRVIKIQWV